MNVIEIIVEKLLANPNLWMLGIVLVGGGLFLVLTGSEIIQFDKIIVKPGKKTWVLGIILLILGIGVLSLSLRPSEKVLVVESEKLIINHNEKINITGTITQNGKPVSKEFVSFSASSGAGLLKPSGAFTQEEGKATVTLIGYNLSKETKTVTVTAKLTDGKAPPQISVLVIPASTPTPAPTVTPTVKPTPVPTVKPTPPPTSTPTIVAQDCLTYNATNLQIRDEGLNGWLLTDGRSRMLMSDNETDAKNALALTQRYTAHCFIGRGNTRPNRKDYIVEYWSGNSGIVTNIVREDCIPYNSAELHILDEGANGWLLTDGNSRMLMLDNETDAKNALALTQQYSFQCFIGRDNNRSNRKDYIVEYWK